VNTSRMNAIPPIISKVRKLLATKVSPYFKPHPPRRPRIEVQLEFPWRSKR
jgi:hypothetical protein